jgi:hypothetical protein
VYSFSTSLGPADFADSERFVVRFAQRGGDFGPIRRFKKHYAQKRRSHIDKSLCILAPKKA